MTNRLFPGEMAVNFHGLVASLQSGSIYPSLPSRTFGLAGSVGGRVLEVLLQIMTGLPLPKKSMNAGDSLSTTSNTSVIFHSPPAAPGFIYNRAAFPGNPITR